MDIQRSYREATVRGASPVELVARLYEQIIEDLRQAVKALEQNQIELRTSRINHAILVIGHLQSQLNFQAGGKVARHLDHFYGLLRLNLAQAQTRQSKEMLSQQITDLLTVRGAWLEVERVEHALAAKAPGLAPANTTASDPGRERVDWKG